MTSRFIRAGWMHRSSFVKTVCASHQNMTDCASLTHLTSCGSFHRFGLRSPSFCSCGDLRQVTLIYKHWRKSGPHTQVGSTCRDWCRMELWVVKDRDCVMGLLARRRTLGHSCAGRCPAEQRELPVKPAQRYVLQVSNGYSCRSQERSPAHLPCQMYDYTPLLPLAAVRDNSGPRQPLHTTTSRPRSETIVSQQR